MSPSVLVAGAVLGQPMGGVRRHNAELLPRVARRLEAHGGRLAVLEGREPPAFALPGGVERVASDVPARPPLLRSLQEGRALRRAVRAAADAGRAFDLVHTGHLPVPRDLPLPYTLTLHDLRSLAGEHTPFSRRFVARTVVGEAVRRAELVFTVSESVRAELGQRYALEPERVVVVPNAADHFEPLPRSRETRAAGPILHVGHLERRKNVELLVRALAEDGAGLPELWLAGAAKHGEDERLRALARELGVLERVRFLGPFDDGELARLYAGAACVALPSRLEGFGIPALEAQRARVPLAIARIPALVEVAAARTRRASPRTMPASARVRCARRWRAARTSSRPPARARAAGPGTARPRRGPRPGRGWVEATSRSALSPGRVAPGSLPARARTDARTHEFA